MKHVTNTIQRGFTLVELLIVVIILALLAAIVVPQFASSTDDAKLSALRSSLSNVRAAVDLYYQQHGEYPSAIAAAGGGDCAAGTVGDGLIDTEDAFLQQLSYYTNKDGAACTRQNAGAFPFGPYLKKTQLPNNPITDVATLTVVTDGDLNLISLVAGQGWKFDNVSGKFIAEDTNTDVDGNEYYTY